MPSRRAPSLFSARAWSKALMLLGALALVAALIGSTGAFSAVDAQRGVSASVASDNALLGLDLADSVDSDTRERLVTVTNNFGSAATVTVELERAGAGTLYAAGYSGSTVSFDLASGASEPVEVVADSPGAVTFTIVASTGGTTVRATRAVSVKAGVIPVDILIKPTEDPNPINPDGEGTVPVAILQEGGFDPTSVNVSSLRFGSDDAVGLNNDEGASPVHGGHVEDVDDDGDDDLVVHFDADETDFDSDDDRGKVVGRTNDGAGIKGDDTVKIVGGGGDGDGGDDGGGDDDGDGDDDDGDSDNGNDDNGNGDNGNGG